MMEHTWECLACEASNRAILQVQVLTKTEIVNLHDGNYQNSQRIYDDRAHMGMPCMQD